MVVEEELVYELHGSEQDEFEHESEEEMGEFEQAIHEEDISKILSLIKSGQYSPDEILLGVC